MKKNSMDFCRLMCCAFLSLFLVACTAGKFDPSKALTQMHVVKSDDYKQRPGWNALVRLGIDDCNTYKNAGNSFFQWGNKTCDANSIIQLVNEKDKQIPVFYAAYHEYGSNEVGSIHTFDNSDRPQEEMLKVIINMMGVLSDSARVDAIYDDYENDRWSMGLNKVSKSDFKNSIANFTKNRDALVSRYQKAHDENQKQYQAERDARVKREKAESIASEREINFVLWQNPTPEQRMIIDALHTVKFTIRDNGVIYANNRFFMSATGLEYFKNSLNLSMESCSDVGAYVDEKVVSRACVQALARDIVEWGKTTKDSSISDRAWNAAAFDGSITYNPMKYEILFSHWAGMARVYSSRGY